MHLVVSGGMSTLTATLPGTPASVAIARRLVREALPGCPRADDLILAVSELASNAIVHSASGQGGTVRVRVRTAPRWARAEVTDDGRAAAGMTSPRNGWVWRSSRVSPIEPGHLSSQTAAARRGRK